MEVNNSLQIICCTGLSLLFFLQTVLQQTLNFAVLFSSVIQQMHNEDKLHLVECLLILFSICLYVQLFCWGISSLSSHAWGLFSGNDYMWHSAGKKHGSTKIFTFSGMESLRPCVAKDFIEICFLYILKNIAVCSFSLYKVVIKTSLMVLLAAFVCMCGLCFVSKNIFSQEMIANYCVHTPFMFWDWSRLRVFR